MSTTPTTTALAEAKDRVVEALDRLADDLERISHQIHAHPEVAFLRCDSRRKT